MNELNWEEKERKKILGLTELIASLAKKDEGSFLALPDFGDKEL